MARPAIQIVAAVLAARPDAWLAVPGIRPERARTLAAARGVGES